MQSKGEDRMRDLQVGPHYTLQDGTVDLYNSELGESSATKQSRVVSGV